MAKKVLLCGCFAFGSDDNGGQPVKSRETYWALQKLYGTENVDYVETKNWKRNPLKLFFSFVQGALSHEYIIMLPAVNGLKIFSRLLYISKKILKRKVYYDVIGGWLPEFLKEKESLASILKKFDGIWVETNTMKLALDKCGFSNVTVVPNFKELKALKEQELEYPSGIPLRLCTFSRVTKDKGIGTIAGVIKSINEAVGYTVFSLDIYGQIQAGEEEWFGDLESSFPEYIQYKGCVDSKNSIDTIKDYFALVFPTHFYTEGIPGTIIDAYCAGVPVISAKWESYADVIDEGITGFGYEFDNEDELKRLLLSIAEEPQKVLELRRNCLEKAKQFAPERIVADIENYFAGGYSFYPLKFCTFSRVMKEKGIEDAIAAVKAVNKTFGFTVCKLDIYGQISETYENRFDEMKKEFKEEIQYCGCVDPSESVDVLKRYFALLFPTYYEGEGFAGTIIDAFSAGIPVVASDWKYNKEIVTEDVGFLFCTHDVSELTQILIMLTKKPGCALRMRKRCLQKVRGYTPECVSSSIKALLN